MKKGEKKVMDYTVSNSLLQLLPKPPAPRIVLFPWLLCECLWCRFSLDVTYDMVGVFAFGGSICLPSILWQGVGHDVGEEGVPVALAGVQQKSCALLTS